MSREERKSVTGHQARMLLDNALVKEHFDDVRRRLTDEMIGADPLDDDTRRAAALKLAALNDLITMLEVCVVDGVAAERAMEQSHE